MAQRSFRRKVFIEDKKLFGWFKRSYSGIVWHSQAQIQRKELEMGDGGSCGGCAAAAGGGGGLLV